MKNQTPSQRVASRYMEAKLFGLLSNQIGWQDLKRFTDKLQWMFKKGQHTVTSRVERSGDKVILVEAQGSMVKISGFKSKGSEYAYKNLVVEIDGRVVKKTDKLDEVRNIVSKHFKSLGLR